MKICFTGDVFLGGDLNHKSCKNLVDVDMFNKADIRIINLEQPISNNAYIANKGTLYTDSFAISQLNDLKVNAVNFANNHIQDKGLEGIEETINHLKNNKIGYFGGGKNITYAEKFYWLNDDVALLGYCEFGKPYLNQITVATDGSPGVNPLRLEKIQSDLNKLPSGKKAILYFHWGMEHVWLPPTNDIKLAKILLKDSRIITIIGMQSHRVQGVIEYEGKKAYPSIGNFIFPSFYIKPPTQIFYPNKNEKNKIKFISRYYHSVDKPTYKKWLWINRVSLIIEYCSLTNNLEKKFVIQDENNNKINELKGFKLYIYETWINILSLIYKLPEPLYTIIWKLHVSQVKLTLKLKIRFFSLRQLGIKNFINEIFINAKNRIK